MDPTSELRVFVFVTTKTNFQEKSKIISEVRTGSVCHFDTKLRGYVGTLGKTTTVGNTSLPTNVHLEACGIKAPKITIKQFRVKMGFSSKII